MKKIDKKKGKRPSFNAHNRRRKFCKFTNEKIEADYKDLVTLKQFVTENGKIIARRKFCKFTNEKIEADYKDLTTLKQFVTENGKIIASRMTGTKSYHQRQLNTAIKQARFLALIPYCDNH